jgi:hypothetical protein
MTVSQAGLYFGSPAGQIRRSPHDVLEIEPERQQLPEVP